ncbi:MAG: hypothetical protein GC202_09005 [Alphaproteobacteria bacterium]|nr:hypothetical protein [Alphaproteobacteria bacterium]
MKFGEAIERTSGFVTGALGVSFMICGLAIAGYAYYAKLLNGERWKAIACFALAAIVFAIGVETFR